MGHSSVEHRLRSDIDKRHKIKNDIGDRQSLIAKLTEKISRTKKKRLNNRYSATVRRLDAEVKILEQRLYDINLDLQKRITDEMEFSEEEIRSFREQYQKEQGQMEEIESKLKAIEQGDLEPGSEGESEVEPASKEAMVARTRRMLRREKRLVEGIQKEISSEERDRVLFAEELRQITAELEAFGGR